MGLFDWLNRSKGTDLPETMENIKKNTGNYSNTKHFTSLYKPIIFTAYYDDSKIVNREHAYLTYLESEQLLYIRKVWNLSKRLIDKKIIAPKMFFEFLDDFENTLQECPYTLKHFNPKHEYNYYLTQKSKVLVDFINRSFEYYYRTALERKTIKSRITNIDNWFNQMEYYKQYLSETEINVIDDLYNSWINGARKTLGESL